MNQNIKEYLREKVDLEDYINQLIGVNSNGKAVCPFHDDTEPSLSINGDLWRCFGCDRGGDIYNFIMYYYKVSFKEALKILADYLGIELEEDNEFKKYLNELKRFYSILSDSEKVRKYFDFRKIPNELIDVFGIKYYGGENLELFRRLFGNSIYLVKDSIVFPIHDLNGRVIGFSFKPFIESKRKYVNQNKNKYFGTSRLFYNLKVSYKFIKETNTVILVEGFFDVFRLYSNGYKNVLSLFGVNLSSDQIFILKSLKVSKVILFFDGDDSGRKASINNYYKLVSEGFEVYIVDSRGYDPDEYLLELENKFTLINDPLEFFNKYYGIDELPWFLTTLSNLKDIKRFYKEVEKISNYYDKIKVDLILAQIKKGVKNDLKYSKIRNPQYIINLIRAFVVGLLDDWEVNPDLFGKYKDDFLKIKELYFKYGYINVDKVEEIYLEPVEFNEEYILQYFNELKLRFDNLDINELIEIKRVKTNEW